MKIDLAPLYFSNLTPYIRFIGTRLHLLAHVLNNLLLHNLATNLNKIFPLGHRTTNLKLMRHRNLINVSRTRNGTLQHRRRLIAIPFPTRRRHRPTHRHRPNNRTTTYIRMTNTVHRRRRPTHRRTSSRNVMRRVRPTNLTPLYRLPNVTRRTPPLRNLTNSTVRRHQLLRPMNLSSPTSHLRRVITTSRTNLIGKHQ